jgi:energy-coupling factor transport system ATP-binding protein
MPAQPSPSSDQIIRLLDVSFTYPDAHRPALSGVSLEVGRGEVVVIMGATGAGKTTLAKCLNRTIPSFQPGRLEGEIWIAGRRMVHDAVADLAGVVGLVSQDFEAQLFSTNVAQEVAFGLEQLGVPTEEIQERVAKVLRMVGLTEFEHRDPATLSGGEKQRLAIAAVLALHPPILVLDEPSTDLDPLGKTQIFALLRRLREAGLTIMVVEHEIAAATHADRLVLMSEGRIVADDRPQNLLWKVARLESLGVRPHDLDRLGCALGRTTHVASVDEAEALVRPLISSSATVPMTDGDSTGPILLEVDDVRYDYDNGVHALAGVSLSIRCGEFIALIGQNGSGKTTLAKHLNGLLQPHAGAVRLDGHDLRELPFRRVAAEVGYVFQNPDHQIFAATVRDEVSFGLRNFGCNADEMSERVTAALRAVGLEGCEEMDPFLFAKGQRQRLAVASLLVLRPRLLILDEPTTGLDYTEQRRMMDLVVRLHREGMTVLMITHSPWVVAEYARRGILMRNGRIELDGPPRDLFAEEELLAQCHFEPPVITRLGRRLGLVPLTAAELLASIGVQWGQAGR